MRFENFNINCNYAYVLTTCHSVQIIYYITHYNLIILQEQTEGCEELVLDPDVMMEIMKDSELPGVSTVNCSKSLSLPRSESGPCSQSQQPLCQRQYHYHLLWLILFNCYFSVCIPQYFPRVCRDCPLTVKCVRCTCRHSAFCLHHWMQQCLNILL